MISLDSAGLFSSLFLKQDPARAAAELPLANLSPPDDDGNDSPDNIVSAASLTYRRAERTALQIRTQEGDVVRLKFNVEDSLRAEAATVEDDDTVIAELSVRARSTTRVKISVQGDLNADELAAIQSVVEQAGALANEFFAGGTAEAAALASAIELNPDQLEQVRLRLSLRERLTYTQIGTAPIGQPAPAAVSDAVPTIADEAQPAPGTVPTEPAQPALPAAAAESAVPDEAPANPAGAGQPALFPDILSAFDAIATFLTNLLEALSAVPAPSESSNDTNAFALRYDVSFKLRVFQSILISVAEAAGDDGDETLPPIVEEALEGLAAERDPALEATA